MDEERRRILAMLAEGKITVDEAERLLAAVGAASAGSAEEPPSGPRSRPQYIRVVVDRGGPQGEKVNVRVPLKLLRAGLKLSALLPDEAKDKVGSALREKGVDFDLRRAKPEDIEELIDALTELTVNVDDAAKGEKVRVFCE